MKHLIWNVVLYFRSVYWYLHHLDQPQSKVWLIGFVLIPGLVLLLFYLVIALAVKLSRRYVKAHC